MGFIEDMEFILSRTQRDRQTGLFSATMDENVMRYPISTCVIHKNLCKQR